MVNGGVNRGRGGRPINAVVQMGFGLTVCPHAPKNFCISETDAEVELIHLYFASGRCSCERNATGPEMRRCFNAWKDHFRNFLGILVEVPLLAEFNWLRGNEGDLGKMSLPNPKIMISYGGARDSVAPVSGLGSRLF